MKANPNGSEWKWSSEADRNGKSLQVPSMTVHDCNTMQRLLHPYLDHELNVMDSIEIHAHLIHCVPGKTLYHAQKLFLDLLHESLPVPTASPDLQQKVRRCVEETRQFKRVGRGSMRR